LKKTISYIIALVFAAGISSCKKDTIVPDQEKVYSAYKIEFNKTLNKTTASATFTMNSASTLTLNKLELPSPSKVTYAGDDLIFNSSIRTYSKEFYGQIEDYFIYTNYYQAQFANESSLPDSILLPNLPDTSSLSVDFFMQWDGNPIQENELVLISFNNITNGQSFTVSSEIIGTTGFYINGIELENMGTGTTVIKISRSTSKAAPVVNKVGGHILMKYEMEDTIYFY
jgi:hypothetical protein